MKYKVGDKFKAKPGMPGLFKEGEIIGIRSGAKSPEEYFLKVTGHVDWESSSEHLMVVLRDVDMLDLYYSKMPNFYSVGKTYMFGDPKSLALRYTIEEVYQNDVKGEWMKLQALARVKDAHNSSYMVILTSDSFNSATEV